MSDGYGKALASAESPCKPGSVNNPAGLPAIGALSKQSRPCQGAVADAPMQQHVPRPWPAAGLDCSPKPIQFHVRQKRIAPCATSLPALVGPGPKRRDFRPVVCASHPHARMPCGTGDCFVSGNSSLGRSRRGQNRGAGRVPVPALWCIKQGTKGFPVCRGAGLYYNNPTCGWRHLARSMQGFDAGVQDHGCHEGAMVRPCLCRIGLSLVGYGAERFVQGAAGHRTRSGHPAQE